MSVKALFFDVFGTLVDWRSSVAREAQAVLKPLGHALDWPAFADAWRDQYQPSCRASAFPHWRRTRHAISISPGTALTPGPM